MAVPRGYDPAGQREGARTPTLFLLPASAVTIEDNWFTMGLAGTGSRNSIAMDVFVPKHRAVRFIDLMAGTSSGGTVQQPALPSLNNVCASLRTGVTRARMAEAALQDFVTW